MLLCDDVLHGPEGTGNVHLMNVFTAIRPRSGFPHVQGGFTIFLQCVGGVGEMALRILVRSGTTDEPVFGSAERRVPIRDRLQPVRVVFRFENCWFPSAGVYFVEGYCNGQWIADQRLQLRNVP